MDGSSQVVSILLTRPIPQAYGLCMKITYDTVADAISSPELSTEQNRALQSQLVAALAKNEPVRDVAYRLLTLAKELEKGN